MNQLHHSELQQVAGSTGTVTVFAYGSGYITVCQHGDITIYGTGAGNVNITIRDGKVILPS